MFSMVTANTVAERNRTIDYNAGEAYDVVIKVLGQSRKHVCNVAYDHYNYSRKYRWTCLRRCFKEDFKAANISIENISCEISKLVTIATI